MYIPIGPSKKDLYKIIIGLLLIVYLIFLGMYKPKAQVLAIQSDYGVTYGNNAQLINSPNSNTTWNWGYNFNNTSGRVDALEIYFHSNGEDITSFNQYLTFMVGGYNQTFPLSNNNMTPFSVGGAVLKVQGATYMCSVDSNNSNTSYNNNSFNTWSATINCDTSSGVNIGKSYNFASLWIQINSINGYSQFYAYISKDMYASDSKLFTSNNAVNDIKNNTDSINNSINDSSIDSSSANDLTSNSAFHDSNGLDAIIKAPLNFIQSLTSSTCSAISLTIPYIDANVSLPCMSTIYSKALGQQLVNLIALVINGVVLYRYCLKILELVHNAKNPNKDELEVLDL